MSACFCTGRCRELGYCPSAGWRYPYHYPYYPYPPYQRPIYPPPHYVPPYHPPTFPGPSYPPGTIYC